MKKNEITEKSKEVLIRHAFEAHYDGEAIVDVSKSERGNLADLVKKGFVKLYDGDENITWMTFTLEGKKYLKENAKPIEIDYLDFSELES